MSARLHGRILLEPEREAALARAAQAGDRAAFLELARHHALPLYRLSFALTLDHAEAQDLTVESIKRADAEMGRFAPGKRFFPRVLRIARNLMVARSRRQAGQTAAHRSGALPEGLVADSTGPLGPTSERGIIEALRNLRPDEQMALALRIVEHHPYGEIAELLDQPLRVTIARLAGARGALLSREARAGAAGDGIHLTLQQLSAFIDGELPEASTAIVQRHLSVCEGCADLFGRLEAQEAILARLLNCDLSTRASGAVVSSRHERSVHPAWWVGLAALLIAVSTSVVAVRVAPVRQRQTELRGGAAAPTVVAIPRLTPASLSPRDERDPLWLEESAATAERIAARAESTSSAGGFDVAASAWATILPHLTESPEDVTIGRFEMAKARFRAWEISPTPRRAVAAESAAHAYLRVAPAGPDRDLASAWLAQVER